MPLDTQVNMYSVDTGHFYSNTEKYLHTMNCKYRSERNYLKNKSDNIRKELAKNGYSIPELSDFDFNEHYDVTYPTHVKELMEQYQRIQEIIAHKRAKAKESKIKLSVLLENKVNINIKHKGHHHIRYLRENELHDTNVISIFESSLTRYIGVKKDELTTALVVLQIYYFDMFKDMLFNGFVFQDHKYVYLTSSAGQTRHKKAVFIREDVWNRIEKRIMCGLTINKINLKGGNNVTKHLAYLALANSATDEWVNFDIDRAIVVDDFETQVHGTFDLIDDFDYSINRITDYVPVPHTDGAGMMLPSVMSKNTMFRAPWIKGLLGVFDFKRFIIEHGYSPVIHDIYGKEYDIVKDDIRIIFTKSQFKMYKYYDSWDEYKMNFKKYQCQAGTCNMEEDRIKNATINYQMLQTLTDITDEEILALADTSVSKIKNLCTSQESMMSALGITPYNTHLTSFQKAIKIYPALLSDTYTKDTLRDIKNSLVKKYRSGKLEINGKYTFLLPDFYAACEYWFGHIENPNGLLNDHEVFCWLFRKSNKLDCLRSPHLYKEHAVRHNIACVDYGDRAEEIRKWFTTDGIYTSTKDLISKILQFDEIFVEPYGNIGI